jgi:hypothetical protein
MMHRQIMASVGLSVIVIAVAMDPFAQQVIQYYESTAPSAVAATQHYPEQVTTTWVVLTLVPASQPLITACLEQS